MVLESATIYRFRLPLRRTLLLNGYRIETRQGLILRLDAGNGRSGFGECSPLPGFSHESLDDAFRQLKSVTGQLFRQPDSLDFIVQSGARSGTDQMLFSSVTCAVESAALDLAGYFHAAPATPAVCPLLMGTPDEVLTQFARLPDTSELKLKVGRARLDDDIAVVNALCEQGPPYPGLRLDANRRWTFVEALRFCRSVDAERIAFLEEPLSEYQRLPELGDLTRFPLALDESLQAPDGDLAIFPGLTALVIKPMLTGGLFRAHQFIRQARSASLRAIVSASYESPPGISQLSCLAQRETPDELPGLDTGGAFCASAVERFESVMLTDFSQQDPVLEKVWRYTAAH